MNLGNSKRVHFLSMISLELTDFFFFFVYLQENYIQKYIAYIHKIQQNELTV